MKTLLNSLIVVVITNFSLVTYAQETTLNLNCGEDKIQFNEFFLNGKMDVDPLFWILSGATKIEQEQHITSLTYDQNGNRSISYADFFCNRTLIEKGRKIWQLKSSCGGTTEKDFISYCERIELQESKNIEIRAAVCCSWGFDPKKSNCMLGC